MHAHDRHHGCVTKGNTGWGTCTSEKVGSVRISMSWGIAETLALKQFEETKDEWHDLNKTGTEEEQHIEQSSKTVHHKSQPIRSKSAGYTNGTKQ
eukprot:12275003-Ditylum_brightwellii.AAC.1